MNKLLISRRVLRPFMGLLLIVGTLFAMADNVQAQYTRPSIPVLSLTGSGSGYNADWYPDGRIWVPASPNSSQPREFLMPVFIDNKWATYDQTKDRYQADPIKSFEFSIYYDSSSVRAVGVVAEHPYTREVATNANRIDNRFKPYYEPLAKGFSFSVSDEKNFHYRQYLDPSIPTTNLDAQKGRLFRIVATSTSALPTTDLTREDYKVLLYVKFRVIPKDGMPIVSQSALNSAIYINPESIRYNDLDVRKTAPFVYRRKIDPKTAEEYPDPSSWAKKGDFVTGLSGNRNDDNNTQYALEPVLPGTIYCRIMDYLPQFAFECSRGIGSIPAIEEVQGKPGEWNLVDPITVDSSAYGNAISPTRGIRTIQVRNSMPRTRLVDVTVESDQPWLTFKCVQKGTASKKPLPMPNLTTSGFINYIDNNILGDASLGDPNAKTTVTDGEIHLEIQCDPTKLTLNDPASPDPLDAEKTGIHTGYITFRSPYAGVQPVKVKVTFIYFRNPVEMFRPSVAPGINLYISNSDGTAPGGTGSSKLLIFGTGHRATSGVDMLFGEKHFDYPALPGEFDARWYPWAEKYPTEAANYPNGFSDWAANDEEPRSASRDIKDANETTQSLYYYCKFDAGGVNNYPVVLTWDTRDFPAGSQLYVRTILNGELQQAVNMRQATPGSNTTMSFTINDAREKEFLIEYTLPTVVDFVDANNKPIIKKGWNLLSLPVRPINAEWNNVYPNAINIPYYFSQNQYQSPSNGILKPGIGYYVKYSDVVDKKFAGTYMYNISVTNGSNDEVRLFPGNGSDGGWNSIGALSVPVNVNNISFDDFQGTIPDVSYTRSYGVWGYTTDRGYEEVSQLLPGLGYWIKVNTSGYLHLEYPKQNLTVAPSTKNDVLASSTKLTVRDNAQHVASVYTSNDANLNVKSFEMPPAPLTDMFDVRYLSTNLYVTNENESIIRVQGVEYPVSIEVANSNADLTFTDAATGEYLGSVEAGATKNIVINGTANGKIKVTKVETGDNQFAISNYPNPVSTVSTFNYTITEESDVTVKLFDAMGVEVATLVNAHLAAGNYSGTLNASALATGNYMLNITAGNNTRVVKVSVVK